jgi:hypothetical protein
MDGRWKNYSRRRLVIRSICCCCWGHAYLVQIIEKEAIGHAKVPRSDKSVKLDNNTAI